MNGVVKIFLAAFGFFIIIMTFISSTTASGSVNFFLGIAIGFGLIAAPFTVFGMLLTYFLMLTFLVGFSVLGGYLGAQVTGKDSIGVFAGLVGGGVIGFKIVSSNFFDKLLHSFSKTLEHQDLTAERKEKRLKKEYLKNKECLELRYTKELNTGVVGTQISKEIKSTMQRYGYSYFISARLYLKIIDDEIKLRWVMNEESNSSESNWFISTDGSALQTDFDIDGFGKAGGLAYFSRKIDLLKNR